MNWTVIWMGRSSNSRVRPQCFGALRKAMRSSASWPGFRLLETDPMQVGESRAGHRRITLRGEAGDRSCRTATFGDKLYGLFTGDRLARIYVGSRRYATRSGIRVGASEADVYKTYRGQVVARPHHYTAGHYLEIRDGNRKVVFETDGRRVVQISTGRRPEINYVEGCA